MAKIRAHSHVATLLAMAGYPFGYDNKIDGLCSNRIASSFKR